MSTLMAAPAPPPSSAVENKPATDRANASTGKAMSSGTSMKQIPTQSLANLQAASELIQSLDAAFAEMTTSAASVAKEVEEARKNARVASEVARRYRSSNNTTTTTTTSYSSTGISNGNATVTPISSLRNNLLSPSDGSPSMTPSRRTVPPPPPPPRPSPNTPATGTGKGTPSSRPPPPPPTPPQGTPASTPTPFKSSLANMSNDSTGSGTSTGTKMRTNPRTAAAAIRASSSPNATMTIAQSHAEDVLSLSLELERTKQQLVQEQKAHEETKTSLQHYRVLLEQQQQQQQQQQRQHGMSQNNKTDNGSQTKENDNSLISLQQELESTKQALKEAEADAQMALDLAKTNTESRLQVEEWLQKALEENENLRKVVAAKEKAPSKTKTTGTAPPSKQVPQTNNGGTRSPPPPPPPPPPLKGPATPSVASASMVTTATPSRTMVHAGRELLRRRSAGSGSGPLSSAGKRLKERLQQEPLAYLDETDSSTTSTAAAATTLGLFGEEPSTVLSQNQLQLQSMMQASVGSATSILLESGKRLALHGRWWSSAHNIGIESSITNDDDNETDTIQNKRNKKQIQELEALTRHYCHSVEVKLGRKDREIKEMEAFCSYLEQRMVPEEEEKA